MINTRNFLLFNSQLKQNKAENGRDDENLIENPMWPIFTNFKPINNFKSYLINLTSSK